MDKRRDSAVPLAAGEIVRDGRAPTQSLAVVEKYESLVLKYLYPVLQNCPRKHGVARDLMLAELLALPGLLYAAGKSGQVSKLYAADANLQTLRFWLRFMVDLEPIVITRHQHKTALRGLAEVGAMLGAWIKTTKAKG